MTTRTGLGDTKSERLNENIAKIAVFLIQRPAIIRIIRDMMPDNGRISYAVRHRRRTAHVSTCRSYVFASSIPSITGDDTLTAVIAFTIRRHFDPYGV